MDSEEAGAAGAGEVEQDIPQAGSLSAALDGDAQPPRSAGKPPAAVSRTNSLSRRDFADQPRAGSMDGSPASGPLPALQRVPSMTAQDSTPAAAPPTSFRRLPSLKTAEAAATQQGLNTESSGGHGDVAVEVISARGDAPSKPSRQLSLKSLGALSARSAALPPVGSPASAAASGIPRASKPPVAPHQKHDGTKLPAIQALGQAASAVAAARGSDTKSRTSPGRSRTSPGRSDSSPGARRGASGRERSPGRERDRSASPNRPQWSPLYKRNQQPDASGNAVNVPPRKEVVVSGPNDEEKKRRMEWAAHKRAREEERAKQELNKKSEEDAFKKNDAATRLELRKAAIRERILKQHEISAKLAEERGKADAVAKEMRGKYKGKPLYEKLQEEFEAREEAAELQKRQAYHEESKDKLIRPGVIISGEVQLQPHKKDRSGGLKLPGIVNTSHDSSNGGGNGTLAAFLAPPSLKDKPRTFKDKDNSRAPAGVVLYSTSQKARPLYVDRAVSPFVFSSDGLPMLTAKALSRENSAKEGPRVLTVEDSAGGGMEPVPEDEDVIMRSGDIDFDAVEPEESQARGGGGGDGDGGGEDYGLAGDNEATSPAAHGASGRKDALKSSSSTAGSPRQAPGAAASPRGGDAAASPRQAPTVSSPREADDAASPRQGGAAASSSRQGSMGASPRQAQAMASPRLAEAVGSFREGQEAAASPREGQAAAAAAAASPRQAPSVNADLSQELNPVVDEEPAAAPEEEDAFATADDAAPAAAAAARDDDEAAAEPPAAEPPLDSGAADDSAPLLSPGRAGGGDEPAAAMLQVQGAVLDDEFEAPATAAAARDDEPPPADDGGAVHSGAELTAGDESIKEENQPGSIREVAEEEEQGVAAADEDAARAGAAAAKGGGGEEEPGGQGRVSPGPPQQILVEGVEVELPEADEEGH